MDNNYSNIKTYTEAYYRGILEAEQKKQFEDKIISDPAFAEEVAFYLSTITAAKELRKEDSFQRFKEIYQEQKSIKKINWWNNKSLYIPLAAAAIIIIAVGSYFIFFQPKSAMQLANAYIDTQLLTLPQKMGAADTMQTGIQYYNKQLYDSSLYFFKSIHRENSDYDEAGKNAGLVYLKEKKYEAALMQFDALINTNSGYSKQAAFLKAVTLMARNKAGDKQQAKELLQQVDQQKIEGYEEAEEWLKKF